MTGTSGGDAYKYTLGTMPGTAQGQADKEAYERMTKKDKAYSYPYSPPKDYVKPIPIYGNKSVPSSTYNYTRPQSSLGRKIVGNIVGIIVLLIPLAIAWSAMKH